MTLSERVRELFEVDDTIVSALPGAELSASTSSQDRYRLWRMSGLDRPPVTEFLLPRVIRKIEREWPPYMFHQRPPHLSRAALAAKVEELGPWRVPMRLDHGLRTMDALGWRITRDRLLYRRDLITGTVKTLLGDDLGDTTVLDLGCNSGFFSLEMASGGAKHVDGVDLRSENIAQALFLAEHYEIPNVDFTVSAADQIPKDQQWEVVLNLGVLYHVTQPLEFIRQTYKLCRRFAIIDTVCDPEPVSGFMLLGDKDVTRPTEGPEEFELHPTYRGAIDTIRYAGFSEVVEIVGVADLPHNLYASGVRRCFLAIK